MDGLDPLLLARIQFAVTIGFHILFPTFTIGVAGWLAILEWRWARSGDPALGALAGMWTKVFAIAFGMGVVSGVVLSYEVGANWSEFSRRTGNVLGPLFTFEVLTAFFLEASFLGIMLFGRNRVPRGMHFFATCMVALGTVVSAFWILSANSWMQTPAGFSMRGGVFEPENWFDIVFNPSFPYRLAHMLTAAWLSGAFVVGGVGAWYLLHDRQDRYGRTMLRSALPMIALLAPAQVVIGDLHGLMVREHQPSKLAAIEAHWETQARAPLILFALPDMTAERNHYEVSVPALGSLILTHSFDGVVTGLKEFSPADRPNVPLVFWAFRLMVGIGLFMVLMGATGVLLWLSGRLFEARWFHRLLVLGIPSGFVAVLAGWVTAESGRQPWIVYGIMRTSEGVSPVPGMGVATSLTLFVLVYVFVFGAGLTYMIRLLRAGPKPEEAKRNG